MHGACQRPLTLARVELRICYAIRVSRVTSEPLESVRSSRRARGEASLARPTSDLPQGRELRPPFRRPGPRWRDTTGGTGLSFLRALAQPLSKTSASGPTHHRGPALALQF